MRAVAESADNQQHAELAPPGRGSGSGDASTTATSGHGGSGTTAVEEHNNLLLPSSPEVDALQTCLVDGETGERECVSPDIQFRLPWKVFLAPQDSPGSGWRFFHLVSQGFEKHPFIVPTKDLFEADAVLWLPISTGKPPEGLHNASYFSQHRGVSTGNSNGKSGGGGGLQRVLVLDEGDGSGYYPPAQKVIVTTTTTTTHLTLDTLSFYFLAHLLIRLESFR
jgi:hypothetical protein